ncbi:MAG: class II aldolase/adducin family protein [Fidelibacterota bacterium]|nr:MAG: class II aldolase/adducin family protein [Candidatus Neomarinimicrobiota bacterium]
MTPETDPVRIRKQLLELSLELGKPGNRLALLGEGNTSALVDGSTFFVKASGSQLGTLDLQQLVPVRFEGVLPLLDQELDQEATEAALLAARVDPDEPRPSIETTFHAWLLRQEGVNFVGHTHPVEVNKILCSGKAELFARRRLFPDEVVCCGPRSLFIDYVNPGVALARAIRTGWERFSGENGFAPNLILLRNHGMITVGPTPESVLAASTMAVKAAEIFNGAHTLGEVVFMAPEEVERIHARLDEQYRRKQLHLT